MLDEEQTTEVVDSAGSAPSVVLPPPLYAPEPKLHCQRCGHSWNRNPKMRREDRFPLACALCRSAYWNTPPKLPSKTAPSYALRRDMKARKERWRKTRMHNLARKRLEKMAREFGDESVGVVMKLFPTAAPPVPAVAAPILESWERDLPLDRATPGLPPPPKFKEDV